MNYRVLIFTLMIVVSQSCTLGPRYRVPQAETPEEWKAPHLAEEASPNIENWWELFNDEYLNALEAQAVENNPDLYAAVYRVVEARALANTYRANLFPQLNLSPSYTSTGQLFKIFLPGTFLPPQFAIPQNALIFRIHQLAYSLPLTMSYELDLWGQLKGKYRSACLSAQAQEEALRTSLLTLTSDIAINYFQLRALDSEIQTLEEEMKVLKEALDLTASRYRDGIGNELDVATAQAQYSSTEATYFEVLRQRALLEDMIAALIGIPASDFCIQSIPLYELPPPVPAGLPAQVLAQRPDIAEAERNAAAQHAQIGVAYASFLPSITLTGTLGFFSPDTRQFLRWISRYWSVGANANENIFAGGSNIANLQLAYARFEEASYNYKKVILKAFKEVEDSLNSLEYESKQYNSLEDTLIASRKRVQLSTDRYQSGLVNYLEVIDSQRTELQARLNLNQLLGQRYVATVQLIKALGGSWNCVPW